MKSNEKDYALGLGRAFKGSFIQKYFIITILISYLLITVFLFALGPTNYPIEKPLYLFSYIILSFILLLWGFIIGVNGKIIPFDELRSSNKGILLFKISLFIYIALIPFTLYARTGSYFYNFNAINNLGGAYNDSAIWIQTRGPVTAEYVRIICAPFLIAYLPLGVFYWKKLKKIYRFLFCVGIVAYLGIDFFNGTNRTLADVIILLFVLMVINIIISARGEIPLGKIIIAKIIVKKIKRILVVLIILFTLFTIFFTSTISTRAGGLTIDSNNSGFKFDINNPTLMIFEETETKLAIGTMMSYFTQGYYALGLTLDKPFESTYGFGNSMYVLMSTPRWFKTNYFIERSFLYKNNILNGWDMLGKWSSFYVWFANDISLFGVLALLFFIGLIYGKCWKNVINSNDFISLIVFCQLTMLIFYIPANNQIFQIAEGFTGNSFWICFWFLIAFSRRKKEVKRVRNIFRRTATKK